VLSFMHRQLGTLGTLDLSSDKFSIGLQPRRTFRRTGQILATAGNGTAISLKPNHQPSRFADRAAVSVP
jgi:hypothetical protein